VTRFLVEAYTPATMKIADVEECARHAADDLTAAGTDVRYVRAIFVPEDEMCLHLVDAASAEVADDLVRLDDAGIGAAGMVALVLGAVGAVSLHGRRRSSRPIGD
jgi:hypothetical protein